MPKRSSERTKESVGAECCGPECCGATAGCCGVPTPGCCEVEAVVPIDARGQMVLPKEVRSKFHLKGNDRLAVVAWSSGGRACCLTLLPAEDLAESVRRSYGPLLREILPHSP